MDYPVKVFLEGLVVKFCIAHDSTGAINGELLAKFESEVKGCTWTASQFNGSLAQSGCFCIYAMSETSALLGYCLVQSIEDIAEVLQISIHPACRRKKMGLALLTGLMSDLKKRSYEKIILEVNVNNIPAINMYHKLGFSADGVRKNYYINELGIREDAKLMTLFLTE